MNELAELDGLALTIVLARSWLDAMCAAFMAAPVAWTFFLAAVVALSASIGELLERRGDRAVLWAFGFSSCFAIMVAVL